MTAETKEREIGTLFTALGDKWRALIDDGGRFVVEGSDIDWERRLETPADPRGELVLDQSEQIWLEACLLVAAELGCFPGASA